MAHDETSAIREIKAYMLEWGGHPFDWYVGRASDPVDRLFNQLGVNRDLDAWLVVQCLNEDAARKTVEFSMRVLGTDGDKRAPDEYLPTPYVYAYRSLKGEIY